jgi:hypothetical protein
MLAAPEDGKAVAAITKLIAKEIPMTAIDGIEPAELEFEERRRGRSRKTGVGSGARERVKMPESRRGSPATDAAPRNQRPRTTPSQPEPPVRAATNGAADKSAAARTANVMRFPQPQEKRRPVRHERGAEEDRKVVGFGDDLPAFLARPLRIAARS